ncbi:uncharacterized protein L201_004878 [Kwoniella dendrophila CBS 6074]|uniref:AAA+ ATPase domain-containing protein n=1 Tax=Kwoniella dendrophila CBS 6074 TaxID=1295534 RepID=A0AAX4JYM0_9TREE
MFPYLQLLTYGDDLFNLPQKLINTLSKQQNIESFIPIAIRAILVAIIFSLAKKVFKYVSSRINQRLFPTAYIASSDPSYHWIIAWIAQDDYVQKQIHDFQLCTVESRSLKRRNKNTLGSNETTSSGKSLGKHNSTWSSEEVIGQVLPTYSHAIRIKHKGNYLWVRRRSIGFGGSKAIDHFRVQTIAFRPHVLRDFLIAARDSFFAKEERELLIFHAPRLNSTWQSPVSRPARPWSSVILPNNLKNDLLRDIEKFLSEKEIRWYAARGIPHRRGYLFHGAPGSGKTTLVTAIASKLALDIYVINPAQRGMDDAKLAKLFRVCPAKSVILIEDIDCIFPRGRGQNTTALEFEDELIKGHHDDADQIDCQVQSPNASIVGGGKHDLAPSTVTMSGLLNAIDGVSSQEGCILVATTNHSERLDPALSRAGRFDIEIEFTFATPSQARDLYLHFYPLEEFRSTSKAHESIISSAGGSDDLNEKERISSMRAISNTSPIFLKDQSELEELADKFVNSIFSDEAEVPDEDNQLEYLKDTQTSRVAQPKFSMASLQSFLLRYKEDPVSACNPKNLEEWLKCETSQKSMHKGKAVSRRKKASKKPTEIMVDEENQKNTVNNQNPITHLANTESEKVESSEK